MSCKKYIFTIFIFVYSCQRDDSHIRKCGHVSYNIDKEFFTLNCFFCPKICLDLIKFSEHVKNHHSKIENPTSAVPDFETINVSTIDQVIL